MLTFPSVTLKSWRDLDHLDILTTSSLEETLIIWTLRRLWVLKRPWSSGHSNKLHVVHCLDDIWCARHGNWLRVSFLRILSLLSLHLVTCFWTWINKSPKEASLREQPLTKEIYYSYLQLNIKFLWSSTCEDLKHHGRVSVKLVHFLLVKRTHGLL
jgi:hypothetical protein